MAIIIVEGIADQHKRRKRGQDMVMSQSYALYAYTAQKGQCMNDVYTLISNVGFPIAAFLLMWYQSNTTIKECTTAITELTQHIAHIDEKGDL